jgi:hypothetical protein
MQAYSDANPWSAPCPVGVYLVGQFGRAVGVSTFGSPVDFGGIVATNDESLFTEAEQILCSTPGMTTMRDDFE